MAKADLNDENRITYFATTDARNKRVPFGIKAKDRTKHVYVIGKTGMGKSTLLENMAIQDIQNGEGLAFIDPHGKTAQLLLDYVPEHRIKDVIYFAPFDLDNPIAFNVMEDIGPDKRHLVVSGLMSAFEKIWADAWSARMAYILQNALHALLEYPGATLLGVNKMLIDKNYRKLVVDNISDPTVKSFWVDEFAKYTDRFAAEATPAIQNKVGQFTSNPLIRNIIGQANSSFDIRKIMDERKILIINLSKGLVGENNANLLGSMLVTKIYLAAMSRADVNEKSMSRLPNFYLYVDEFQSFANKSFADILSEARKYKLNLTIAHQYIEQMEEEVRAAVFGNVGTMITFRVGAYDAEVLEKEFAPVFTAEDLVNLGFTQIYLKLMIDGVSSHPFSALTMPGITPPAVNFSKQVIEASREQFSTKRGEVESKINDQMMTTEVSKPETRKDNSNNFHNKDKNSERYISKPTEGKHKERIDKNKQSHRENHNKPANNDHLAGLRKTLAEIVGEPELANKQEDKKDNLKPNENIETEPKSEKENPPNKISKGDSFSKKERNNRGSDENSAHRTALAEILKKLQDKEKTDDTKTANQSNESTIAKEEISPDNLREMLHVDGEENL